MKAKELLERMDYRQHYKCVGEKGLSKKVVDKLWNDLKEEVVCKYRCSGSDLKPEDLSLRKFKINHGLGAKYPLNHVRFYDRGEVLQTRTPRSYALSPQVLESMEPRETQQWILRCFVKPVDPQKLDDAAEAFNVYCQELLEGKALNMTKSLS